MMNGVWKTPEWETATAALEKLQNEKNKSPMSGSDDKSTVKSTSAATSAAGALMTSTPSTMPYDASYYSQYYAAYHHPYASYGMYGFGPYSPYGYMPFATPAPQQMQPPPPPPPSAKTEPKSESSNDQSQAGNSTAASVSADATGCNSNSTVKAGTEATASTASIVQNTGLDSASPGYSHPGSSWQPSVGMASSAAGMWPPFHNTPSPRPKSSGVTGFQSPHTAASVSSGSWQYSVSRGNTGQPSATALRSSRPSASTAMPCLRWSNSPRVNPYDGRFRQAVPKHSSEPYCPFDPTESEECEDQPGNSERYGGFTPAPDAGNLRFRMPSRGPCRPMHWRQQSPRPCFSPEMQSPQRVPVQRSPDWRFGQFSAQQPVPQPDQGNVGTRPVVMPRLKNYTPRARAPWSASSDAQRMPGRMLKPSESQESRWDKDETVPGTAAADKSTAEPSAESGAVSPASADEWPTPLKQFVHRCFSSVKDDRDKDAMEAKLKVKLTAAFGDGTALTHDWEHEPIPDILNSSASFHSLGSPSATDRYGRSPSNLLSPRNFKFAGSLRGRRGATSSGSRRGRGWSPPGFRRRSRSPSHSRKSRSRSSSRSSSSSRHSSRSRRRRHRRRRESR